jgi:hypothetical protein
MHKMPAFILRSFFKKPIKSFCGGIWGIIGRPCQGLFSKRIPPLITDVKMGPGAGTCGKQQNPAPYVCLLINMLEHFRAQHTFFQCQL